VFISVTKLGIVGFMAQVVECLPGDCKPKFKSQYLQEKVGKKIP
jgi:hypothetical protein